MPGRRFALYFAWHRPSETEVPLGQLEERYPTLFEFRRAIWPYAEKLSDKADQGVGGFLDHVVRPDFDLFCDVIRETTGQDVQIFQRHDGQALQELDSDFLADVDTLIIVSLDHQRTAQAASKGEADLIRDFLGHEHHCLVVCPHHNVGATGDSRVELAHHGDRLVPATQHIGGFAQSVFGELGLPIQNLFGLQPGRDITGGPAPLTASPDLDPEGLLKDVSTFNIHPHLPHLSVPSGDGGVVKVLARQPIAAGAETHPFVAAGNREFNALLRAQPAGLAGRVWACDATLWSSAFGGIQSLKAFWRNLASIP